MKGLAWTYTVVVSFALLSSSYLQAQEVYGEFYDDSCCCYPCEDSGWFFEADLLVLTAHQDGINTFIGSSTNTSFYDQSAGGTSTSTSNSFTQLGKFCFDWNAGCRLGAGYQFCDGWSALAAWTHYHGRAHGHSKQPGAESSGAWKLSYDVVDVLLTTPYYCAWNCVNWNLFGGVKMGWLEEKMHAENEAISISTQTVVETTTTSISNSINFSRYSSDLVAAGPEIGLNVVWDIGCGFSIYGNAAGSVLYAHFKEELESDAESSATVNGTPNSTSSSTYGYKDRDHVFRIVMDLGLGLAWCDCWEWCGHEYPVMLRVGWEQHRWFDQLGPSIGDLYLNGVTLSAAVRF